MQVQDALRARRTVRSFADADVPDDLLREVLGAALAMPHAGNTYDWRALVLRRPRLTHPRWAEIYAAVLHQDYLAEAPVLVVWAVQPEWWAEHYRANVQRILDLGLIDLTRAGQLLETLDTPRPHEDLLPGLVGEAMLGVGAVLLAATDLGLGSALAACDPAALAAALEIPPEAHVMPFGVLALGYPGAPPPGGPAAAAEKPKLGEVCYDGAWGRPLA